VFKSYVTNGINQVELRYENRVMMETTKNRFCLLTQKMENVRLMLSFLPSHSPNRCRLAIPSPVSMLFPISDMYKYRRRSDVPENCTSCLHCAEIYQAKAIFLVQFEQNRLAGLTNEIKIINHQSARTSDVNK
jgi:hypothetical protein